MYYRTTSNIDTLPYYRLFFTVLCGYLSIGATIQTIPLLHTEAAYTAHIVAIFITLSALGAAFSRPIAGYFADRGYEKAVLLFGGILACLGGLGHYFNHTSYVFILARLCLGIGEGAIFTSAVTWLLTRTPSKHKGTIAGWLGLAMWGGLLIGPLLANYILHITQQMQSIWLLITILPFVGLLLTASIQPSRHLSAAHTKLALLPQQARLPGFAFLLTSYGYGTINALLMLYLQQTKSYLFANALTLFASAFLLVRLLGQTWVSIYGGRRILLICCLLESIGFLLISDHVHTTSILFGILLAGAGMGLLYPAFVTITTQRVPNHQHGAAIGLMTSFWDTGILLAGPIGGAIANYINYQYAFYLAGFCSVIAFFIILGPLAQPTISNWSNAHDSH